MTPAWHDGGMAGQEELIDSIAGFGLFADLTSPQLESIVHTFEETAFAEGERVLRQNLSGSGFFIIVDGEVAIVVDGNERARLGRGDFFGEVSILLQESPIADVVATRPLRCLVQRVVCAGASGRPRAHRLSRLPARPPAPGEYTDRARTTSEVASLPRVVPRHPSFKH